jgi:nuclear pore complex protein Nup188
LEDQEVTQLLSNPFRAFPEPSPQSKSAFETKTSAINVTPSSNGKYDIKQIKEDALWLSKAAKVDEVSALRVVVEECQARPAAQLLGPFSEEELVGVREAAGNSRYSSPIPLSLLAQTVDPATIQQEFEKEPNRRTRILRTYLSERRHFLKCSERLLHAAFYNVGVAQQKESPPEKGKEPVAAAHWLATAGDAIYNRIPTEAGLATCAITAIERNMRQLESESGWSDQCNGGGELEHDWVQTQVIEAIHNMEIIWILVMYTIDCPSSTLALAWFRLQHSCKFFSVFEMVR